MRKLWGLRHEKDAVKGRYNRSKERGKPVKVSYVFAQLSLAIKKKQTEKTLLESEERYRSLIENAEDTIFTLSLDGIITSLNPAFKKNTGWSQDGWIV